MLKKNILEPRYIHSETIMENKILWKNSIVLDIFQTFITLQPQSSFYVIRILCDKPTIGRM